jgi:hypothetical protein
MNGNICLKMARLQAAVSLRPILRSLMIARAITAELVEDSGRVYWIFFSMPCSRSRSTRLSTVAGLDCTNLRI